MTSPSHPSLPEDADPAAREPEPNAALPAPASPEGAEVEFTSPHRENSERLEENLAGLEENLAPPRYSESLALFLFAALLLTFIVLASAEPGPTAERGDFEQSLELRLQGRYLVGVDAWFSVLPGGQANRAQLRAAAHDLPFADDRAWCAALLFRELGDAEATERAKAQPRPRREELAGALEQLLADPPVLPDPSLQPLVSETCDFLGELAWARATPDSTDEQTLLAGARRFAGFFLLGMMGAALLLVLGCFLAGTALFLHRKGRLAGLYASSLDRLAPPAREANARVPYLELGSLFFIALFGLGVVGSLLGDGSSPLPMVVNWLILPVFGWPLWRGRTWAETRVALGWHRGQGWWREIGAGLVAYIAAAPLLVVGLTLTVLVSRWSEQTPYHPIVDWIRSASPGGLVIALTLAVIWAPLCEESAFRGALYHYGRGRLGPWAAGLAVALVFAAIHPQGLAGVPFLTSLALALALAREWRGSIVASMTMHLVHNLAIFLFMILVIR